MIVQGHIEVEGIASILKRYADERVPTYRDRTSVTHDASVMHSYRNSDRQLEGQSIDCYLQLRAKMCHVRLFIWMETNLFVLQLVHFVSSDM